MRQITPLEDFLNQNKKQKIKSLRNFVYAGIGSRDTPKEIMELMTKIANKLEDKGYILRSGGAIGADLAFEQGVKNNKNKEIFYAKNATDLTREIACYFHPAPENLKKLSFREKQFTIPPAHSYAHNLMARNTFQIMGKNLNSPVDFVLCWTPDGCTNYNQRTQKTGGTGQAISIASYFNIPVYNLANFNLDVEEIFKTLSIE